MVNCRFEGLKMIIAFKVLQLLTFPVPSPARPPTIETQIVLALTQILTHSDFGRVRKAIAFPKAIGGRTTIWPWHDKRIGVVVSEIPFPEAAVIVTH
jgi:hypothetical protein